MIFWCHFFRSFKTIMLSKAVFCIALATLCFGIPAPDHPPRLYSPPQAQYSAPSQYSPPPQQTYQQPRQQYSAPKQYIEPPKYEFSYAVNDHYSGNNFGHAEKRDGYRTEGSYYVLLPDGRTQTVTYYVDGDSGYVAKVTYSGEAKYPEPQRQSYKPPQQSYQQPEQTYQQPKQIYQQPQQTYQQPSRSQYGF